MSPAMGLAVYNKKEEESETVEIDQYQNGVRHLCEKGLTKVPGKYIFPVAERPNITGNADLNDDNIKLPVIDFTQLQGCNRAQVLECLSKACEEYGFFQLINHGIPSESIQEMIGVSKEFFELPFEERSEYMSSDMTSTVRCGTSFNQNNDRVFCWRDFLKLTCHPLSDVLPYWPSSPTDLRHVVATYSKEIKFLYLLLVEAILESLGLKEATNLVGEENDIPLKDFEDGSQLIVINYYPSCPEPELTLGIHPHSDHGFLTLLLQDEVKGLQIQHGGRWVNVEPIPNSFVVNVGDHLEIFSNGRYKSVSHRVLVNPTKSRMSVASLHSLPFDKIIRPSPKLISEANPRRYMDTGVGAFLDYLARFEHECKNFLESRKLTSVGN